MNIRAVTKEQNVWVPVHDVVQVQVTEVVWVIWTVLYRRLLTSLKDEGGRKDDGISKDMEKGKDFPILRYSQGYA